MTFKKGMVIALPRQSNQIVYFKLVRKRDKSREWATPDKGSQEEEDISSCAGCSCGGASDGVDDDDDDDADDDDADDDADADADADA